ncbi:MAG: ABC transporter ATP-binding protein [Desulfohalobiaceae bacterium]|nr:ABC transporter ATP-binding protein [Desulfohalobiaceae bacterium]
MARIKLENISHSYSPDSFPEEKKEYAVSNLDICWEDGSSNALLGPSGCGKTTILNIISGLLRPSRGRILVDDQDVTGHSPRRRRIAQVFQFPVVYDSMNVFDNLAFPLRNQGQPEQIVRSKVTEVAEVLDLQDYLYNPPAKLNAAEKQKISLGRGLVREDTAAVLLDEPLTVIDPKLKGSMRRKLKEVQKNLRKTMIYVTHDQHEALTFADEVTIVKDGRLVQKGSPEELHSQPATPFIGYFIGSPGMNILDCTLKANKLEFKNFSLSIGRELLSRIRNTGTSFQLGIRPEFVRAGLSPGENTVPFEVSVVENTGAYWIVTYVNQETRIKARVPESIKVEKGQRHHLFFPEDRINLFHNEQRVI